MKRLTAVLLTILFTTPLFSQSISKGTWECQGEAPTISNGASLLIFTITDTQTKFCFAVDENDTRTRFGIGNIEVTGDIAMVRVNKATKKKTVANYQYQIDHIDERSFYLIIDDGTKFKYIKI